MSPEERAAPEFGEKEKIEASLIGLKGLAWLGFGPAFCECSSLTQHARFAQKRSVPRHYE